jgi:NAD(P)-dependent dehydrogenase (short-subunit alcohol dehydrogenase family)
VADEIRAAGGEAIAHFDDISEPGGAGGVLELALGTWGRIDCLVNNAGILRDRMAFNMSVEEWDSVIKVHLKGTFCTTRHAVAGWRELAKQGEELTKRVINTTSTSGLFANPGQANYGAAKSGIASFTIIAARELQKYGITVNAVSPGALTRMTEDLGMGRATPTEGEWNPRDPDNIAPIVVWLGSEQSSSVTGRIFQSSGGTLGINENWRRGPSKTKEGRWDPAELASVVAELAEAAEDPPGIGTNARQRP